MQPGPGEPGASQPKPSPLADTRRFAAYERKSVIDCAVYVDGCRQPGNPAFDEALAEVRENGQGFCWLGLYEPNARLMTSVAKTFGLHELAVEDAVHARQRPKLERYDDQLVMVLRTVAYVAANDLSASSEIVETGEIMIFVGPDFVITVRHGAHGTLRGVRRALEARPTRLAQGPGAVLHAITDHVVDDYLSVIRRVEADVDHMEELVFTPGNQSIIASVYLLKREIVEMRRAVHPLGSPLHTLVTNTDLGIPKEIRRYFRDVADHHTQVTERIAEFDGALTALINAALAKVTNQQNDDMRRISAWVAIIVAPTLIAGIYGMNFDHMPELHWRYGYELALGLMAFIGIGLYLGFKRKDWI
ncbi:magnesium/cobalt transporter CorA [Smaragdicoccus niigatensis]|uniref:magnesium/cobalt transporter CorA n=1 Tax=Smaragdicoccus niigatensis TaxID=359359 RepID=UPI0003724F9B|nr:magnesium/cobalt transporter CorA [Smaragdicoccus niigatensis]